jgi:hypothetical protein
VNINDLAGKRILAKAGTTPTWYSTVEEYRVLEVSPSGNWVRLMNAHGNKFWRAVTEVSFVEELRDLKADKPRDGIITHKLTAEEMDAPWVVVKPDEWEDGRAINADAWVYGNKPDWTLTPEDGDDEEGK